MNSAAAARSVNREAFRTVRALVSAGKEPPRVLVLLQDTGGDFGLSGAEPLRAWLGGLRALAATVQKEWPQTAVKAIDIAHGHRSSESLARAIADELILGGQTAQVGLRADGTRTVRRLCERSISLTSRHFFDSKSVVVATGGARGVTAAALIELARTYKPRIALFGRTILHEEPESYRTAVTETELRRVIHSEAEASGQKLLPVQVGMRAAEVLACREIRTTLAALEAAGATAAYYSGDVRDATALKRTLAEVRADFGAITALVHGAGVLWDKRIEDKTDEQFDLVFDTKVVGLAALLEATAADPLNWICLFSSVVAHQGNAGQADYAMANEVLNQVAASERARRGERCWVRSIGWGPLAGGMVTPELGRHFARNGIPLLPLAIGAEALVAEAAADASDPQVVIGNFAATPQQYQASMEVLVDAHSHSYLRDHAVAGVPVVPLVLAMEWFMRAARSCHPSKFLTALHKLRVHRGIKLTRFDRGERLIVRCQSTSSATGTTCKLELLGTGNVLHYTAVVELADAPPPVPPTPAPPEGLSRIPGYQIYDGYALFHGPQFQVLSELLGFSKEGATATLWGLSARGFPAEKWQLDVAAMDGAAQLTGLCGKLLLGAALLPMGIEAFRVYQTGPLSGQLWAAAYVRSLSQSKLVCDVVLCDMEGRLLAECHGIENIVRPDPDPSGAKQAFKTDSART